MKKRLGFVWALGLPYVLTIFLPVLSILCLGSMVTSTYHKRIIANKQENIEIALERFAQRIHNVETLSYIIIENNVIKEYAYAVLRGVEHSVVNNIEISELLAGFMTNSDVETIYLYDPQGNRIITPVSAYSNASDYFRFAYLIEDCTPQESVERLKSVSWTNEISSALKVRVFQKETEVIEYRLAIPPGRVSGNQPQIILVLEIRDILSDLFDILQDSDEFYLYDSKDRLIYSSGRQYDELIKAEVSSDLRVIRNEGQKIYKMECNSADQSWKIKVCMPELVQREGTDQTIRYAWLLMGVSLVASIVFCTYFTFRNHRELQEILDLFRGEKKNYEEEVDKQNIHGYRVIKGYADKIINENNSLRESIPRLQSSHRYEILDKLIRNTYNNQAEIEKNFHERDLDFLTGKCVVFCIRYKGSSYRDFLHEDISVKDFIKSQLEEILERKFEVFDTSARETICVLSMEDMYLNVIAEDIVSRLNVIAYHYNIDMEIGVGNIVDSIYQISESYLQAKAVLRYRESSRKNVHLYTELVQMEEVYYYPKEYDDKIYNYVVAGKEAEAKELIQKIYRENFEENDKILTPSATETIKGRLKDLLILLAGKYQIPLENISGENSGEQSVMSFFKEVYEAVDMIAENIADKKQDVQKNTALKIKHYIDDNFCDNLLSMKQISLALGLHESYISNLFRSEYGEPVSVVIENRRIEKACKLIKNTDMKISDIAQEVGYSSDISFRRAFKKKMGMSPIEYRASLS